MSADLRPCRSDQCDRLVSSNNVYCYPPCHVAWVSLPRYEPHAHSYGCDQLDASMRSMSADPIPGRVSTDPIPEQVYRDAAKAHVEAVGDPVHNWYIAARASMIATRANMPGHRAAVESAYRDGYRQGREQAALDIIAHADRVAPKPPGGVPDAKRRWLRTAAQVAAPTPTLGQVAKAVARGDFVACYLDEAGGPADA